MMAKTKFKQTEIGTIPEIWELEKIDRLYEISSGLSKPRNEFGFGYPFLSFKEIFYNFSLPDELHNLVNTNEKERVNCSIKRGDVFLTRTSETVCDLGMSSVALKDYENATFNGFAKRLRPKFKEKILPEFAVYLFRSNKIQAQILKFSSLTTRASLNASMIKEINLIVPPLQEQYVIASILSFLDSKIKLNQQMNKTLEAIGNAIFKHWFVNFEFPNESDKPYKSSNGKITDSELGKIPNEWKIARLSEYVDVVKGCSYRSDDLKESQTALVTLKSINRGGGLNQDGFKEYIGKYKENQILTDGEIIVAQTDLTQEAEVVGRPAVVNSLGKYSILVASLDLQIIRPKNNFSKNYIYYLLKTDDFHNHALSYTNGTTVLHLNKNAVPEFTSIIPSRETLDKFDEIIEPILAKIIINEVQIQTLTHLRNSLLPKLMSGKIRVPVEAT